MSNHNKSIILLGAGGHAKVLLSVLRLLGKEIIGIVTPDYKTGEIVYGLTVLGNDDVVDQYATNDVMLVNGLGATPGSSRRWALAERLRGKGFSFATLTHPNAIIGVDVHLSEGVQVMAGAVIQPGASIGLDSIVNTGAMIDHDCIIREQCHIAPGVVCSGAVQIGKGAHIGTGARLIQEVSVGENCVIAAGTTLYKDAPASTLVKQDLQLVMLKINESPV